MPIQQMMLGAGGAGDGDYIDDVFDVHLYTGNGSSKTITNGLDISGDGGLVWTKRRDSAQDHYLFDTIRGTGDYLSTNNNYAEESDAQSLSAFTSTGFTVGNNVKANGNNNTYSAWSFKKTTGFFDVVTYTGNGTAGRTISHSLGSAPGMIIVKKTSGNEDWTVYHRGVGNAGWLYLNSTDATQTGGADTWNSTDPTASVFSVSSHALVNENNATYVAYLFAHNDQQFGLGGDNPIIYCGSYTGNGSASGQYLDLGFEPQFFIQKNAGAATGGTWNMFDHIRGVVTDGPDRYFRANTNQTDGSFDTMSFVGNGVHIDTDHSNWNANGVNYVYLAIRRADGYVGKPATAGTDVFTIDLGGINAGDPSWISNFPVDMQFIKDRNGTTYNNFLSTRLTQGEYLPIPTAQAAIDNAVYKHDYMNGWGNYSSSDAEIITSWMWKRHTGFDVVTYIGTGSNMSKNHSMNAVPQMIWVKNRDQNDIWTVGHFGTNGGSSPWNYRLRLNSYTAQESQSDAWNQTAPTSTHFTVGTHEAVNTSGENYIAFLFTSVSGISKCGYYDGSNSDQTITVGFQPRFIIIRRTDDGDDWIVLDTFRGWGSGNDERLRLNETNAEDSDTNWGAPTSTGFTVTGGNGGASTSGGKYVYYAHA